MLQADFNDANIIMAAGECNTVQGAIDYGDMVWQGCELCAGSASAQLRRREGDQPATLRANFKP